MVRCIQARTLVDLGSWLCEEPRYEQGLFPTLELILKPWRKQRGQRKAFSSENVHCTWLNDGWIGLLYWTYVVRAGKRTGTRKEKLCENIRLDPRNNFQWWKSCVHRRSLHLIFRDPPLQPRTTVHPHSAVFPTTLCTSMQKRRGWYAEEKMRNSCFPTLLNLDPTNRGEFMWASDTPCLMGTWDHLANHHMNGHLTSGVLSLQGIHRSPS